MSSSAHQPANSPDEPAWEVGPLPPAPTVPYPGAAWHWEPLATKPQIHESVFLAPGAVVYGRVRLKARSSVWFGCVLRGDHEWIEVGEESNIQDNSVLHVDPGYPCVIGRGVTVAHRAVVHGCVVEDGALIGIGAVVLSRCVIGAGALIAAGAVVLEGTKVPPGTLWAGCPAKQVRELSDDLRQRLLRTSQHYVNNAAAHLAAGLGQPLPRP